MSELTKENIIDACCSAIKLWEFGNVNVDESRNRTDRELIEYYGNKWIDKCKINKRVLVDNDELEALIYTCEIEKIIKVKKNAPKFDECAKYLNGRPLQKYVTKSLCHKYEARWDYGSKFIDELAAKLSSAPDGRHNALASRFLFFAIPQAFIFNYSSPLCEVLKTKVGLKDKSVKVVGAEMSKLFASKYELLHNLPQPKYPSKLSKSMKIGHWWERRVLDLAVLNHWN